MYNLFTYPSVINDILDLLVSFKRLDEFFIFEELDTSFIDYSYKKKTIKPNKKLENGIKIKGSFYWRTQKEALMSKQSDASSIARNKVTPIQKNDPNPTISIINTALDVNELPDSRTEAQLGSLPNNLNAFEEEKKESILESIDVPEDDKAKEDQLSNLNMKFKKGKLTALVGEIGSGKSSLFDSFFGEMKNRGENSKIQINGKLAYVSQRAWIQGTTVKNNIIFGNQFDEKKYQEALSASCLYDDLKELSHGDNTILGDKGINLSGGQKARISFARAVYSDSDIFLL